jgi:hypothetical protein
LIVLRFRGAFNGGSDYVTTLSLIVVWLFHSFPQAPNLQLACLLYLGLQIVFSYFLSGLSKIRSRSWLRGEALAQFLVLDKYQIPVAWREMAFRKSPLLRLASFAVLAFELSFPVVLLSPDLCLIWMAAGAIFHWMNFRIFGLNRFFWIWLACYPALYEASIWISGHVGFSL